MRKCKCGQNIEVSHICSIPMPNTGTYFPVLQQNNERILKEIDKLQVRFAVNSVGKELTTKDFVTMVLEEVKRIVKGEEC